MPPFRLELPDKVAGTQRRAKLLYTKSEYSPGIKITDWNGELEALPYDNDPYEARNYFLTHYNRLGTSTENPYITTTQEMLSQVSLKGKLREINRTMDKYMVNFFSCNNCVGSETDNVCTPENAECYTTTMQKSYTPPYPFIMNRLSVPKTPYMLNRRFKWDDPYSTNYKFYDDGLACQISTLQKIRQPRAKSYDPGRAEYTDGTLVPVKKLKCYELEYKK